MAQQERKVWSADLAVVEEMRTLTDQASALELPFVMARFDRKQRKGPSEVDWACEESL